MRKHTVAYLAGDGVGPYLISQSVRILDKLGATYGFSIDGKDYPFGKGAFNKAGTPLPDESVKGIRKSDAAIVYAVDAKDIPGPTPVGILRKKLDLFAEVRVVNSIPGHWSLRPAIHLAFVREITEGFLADRNLFKGNGEWMTDSDTACSLRVIHYSASKRIAEFGFSFALTMGYKKLTAIHKATIFQMTDGLFLRACRETAEKYRDIDYEEKTADDCAGDLVSNPEKFSVILSTNMFGDILSDEGAALVSGLCVGVNIGSEAKVYMPVRHGAAYDYADSHFDFMPRLCSLVELLRGLGEKEAATGLNDAMLKTQGKGTRYLEELFENL